MKKKSIFAAAALLVSALGLTTLVSCDKDTLCYVKVTVVDEANGNAPVKGAYVKIDNNGSSIYKEGATNDNGVFQTNFPAPAIFDVHVLDSAVWDTNYNRYMGYRTGEATFKLKTAETVDVTVVLDDQVHYIN
ncbi:MAG: carboxypeptidase-like regulatory domain-containing protein [Bacteroidales bacterium]|nr:carboxypeptidase-like regulatory domain-containing protein [Bacteroidales bacterium]